MLLVKRPLLSATAIFCLFQLLREKVSSLHVPLCCCCYCEDVPLRKLVITPQRRSRFVFSLSGPSLACGSLFCLSRCHSLLDSSSTDSGSPFTSVVAVSDDSSSLSRQRQGKQQSLSLANTQVRIPRLRFSSLSTVHCLPPQRIHCTCFCRSILAYSSSSSTSLFRWLSVLSSSTAPSAHLSSVSHSLSSTPSSSSVAQEGFSLSTSTFFPHYTTSTFVFSAVRTPRRLLSRSSTSSSSSLTPSAYLRSYSPQFPQMSPIPSGDPPLSTPHSQTPPVSARLHRLRQLLSVRGLDCYVVFAADAHNSEIPCAHDERRAFLSGFSGSAGTAVITQHKALLWTDGRYFLQASQQLDAAEWELMKFGVKGVPKVSDWIDSQTHIKKLGLDAFTTSFSEYSQIKGTPRSQCGALEIAFVSENLVDQIWGDCQPPIPASPVTVHPEKFAGVSVKEKLRLVDAEMKSAGTDGLLLSSLDEVAWLLNLRGSDFTYSPVFLSYLMLHNENVTLYTDSSRVTQDAAAHLKAVGVTIKCYGEVLGDVKALYNNGTMTESTRSVRLWLDPGVNMAIYNSVHKPEANAVLKVTPAAMMKAKKNHAELEGMREAHIRDGLAKTLFLYELDELAKSGKLFTETECTLQQRLDALRAAQQGCKGLSFATISSIGPNGAVIHYRAEASSCLQITPDMYLVDSGGQYDCGTTDVTRTIHFGTPTEFQKECWTRVLKGFIAFSKAVFPRGTKGPQLEVLARRPLWEAGLDYRHGTGHGVGACLHVHEGPIAVHSRLQSLAAQIDLEEGMIVSVEPGYYRDGEFGIRIENLVEVAECTTVPNNFGGIGYLMFRQLTLIPLCKKMMELAHMTSQEIDWVNEYHKRVQETLSSRLGSCVCENKRDLFLKWLSEATSPLQATSAIS